MTRYLVLFAILFPSALLLEGLMLPVFKVPLKGNAAPLLCVNFAVQAVMAFIISQALAGPGWVWTLFILFFAGFVLMMVKGLVYEHFLKARRSRQCLAYGIVASIISWVAFSIALYPLNTLLESIS